MGIDNKAIQRPVSRRQTMLLWLGQRHGNQLAALRFKVDRRTPQSWCIVQDRESSVIETMQSIVDGGLTLAVSVRHLGDSLASRQGE
jgi:hypothetical protein